MSRIKDNINNFAARGMPTIREKYETNQCIGSHLVNIKKKLKYKYYICDYCGAEIIISSRWEQADGGIVPLRVEKNRTINLALHNRCLNKVLKELN